jgi:hypothetical protein
MRRSRIKLYNKITILQGILRNGSAEFTPESLQAAGEVDPADALCLSRRARNFSLAADPGPYWADLYSKLAVTLAPGEAEAAWRRAAVLALAGRGAQAAAVAGAPPTCRPAPAGRLLVSSTAGFDRAGLYPHPDISLKKIAFLWKTTTSNPCGTTYVYIYKVLRDLPHFFSRAAGRIPLTGHGGGV